MFDWLETYLFDLIDTLPLELFVLIGSFIEEVIAPVPALAVMLITGSAAAVQGLSPLDLIPLAIIAALGKTVGAIIVYEITNRVGGMFLTKWGPYFKVSESEIRALGQKLSGTKRDYLFLTFIRAMPVVPSSVVSVGCGLLRIPFTLFLTTTFVGTIVRDGIFLYVGYSGITVFEKLAERSAAVEDLLQTGFIVLVVSVFAYIYYRRSKNPTF